jgi:hypothetical protein
MIHSVKSVQNKNGGEKGMKLKFLKVLIVLSLLVMPAVAGSTMIDQLNFNVGTGTTDFGILQYTKVSGTGALTTIQAVPIISVDAMVWNDSTSHWQTVATVSLTSPFHLTVSTGTNATNVPPGGWYWTGGTVQLTGPGSPNLTATVDYSTMSKGGSSTATEYSSVIETVLPGWLQTALNTALGPTYYVSSAWAGDLNLPGTFMRFDAIKNKWVPTNSTNQGDSFTMYVNAGGSLSLQPVPIPPTVLLLGAGLVGMVVVRKRIV